VRKYHNPLVAKGESVYIVGIVKNNVYYYFEHTRCNDNTKLSCNGLQYNHAKQIRVIRLANFKLL